MQDLPIQRLEKGFTFLAGQPSLLHIAPVAQFQRSFSDGVDKEGNLLRQKWSDRSLTPRSRRRHRASFPCDYYGPKSIGHLDMMWYN